MNQTLHILRKDWRRMRPWLYVWFGYLLTVTALAMRDPIADAKFYVQFSFFTTLGAVLGIGWMVQQDRLVGTTAFWMTRPVSRRALLQAKTIFAVAVFGAPPVMLHGAVLLRFGLEPERWGWAAIETVVPWAAGLAAVLAMAAVTPTLAAFFVASVLAYFLVQSIGMVIVSLIDPGTVAVEYRADRRLAAMALGAGLFLTVFVRQVVTPLARLPLLAMAAAVAGSVLLHLAPLGGWMRATEPIAAHDVRMEFGGLMPNDRFGVRRTGEGRMALWTRLRVEGMPDERVLEVLEIRGRVECGAATAEFVRGGRVGPGQEARQLRQGARWARDEGQMSGTSPLAIEAPPDRLIALFDRPCAVMAEVDARFLRNQTLAVLPLSRGEQYERGSGAARIDDVRRSAQSLNIDLTLRNYVSDMPALERRPRFALVRRASNEWLTGAGTEMSLRSAPAILPGPTIRVADYTLVFDLRDLERWAAGAELALLEQVPEGRIRQSFKMSDVWFEDTTDGTFRAGSPMQ